MAHLVQQTLRREKTDDLVERFKTAMSRTAAGVAIVTSDGPAGRGGVTVSSFCSVSLDPPSALACIRKDSSTLALILENGTFAANILAEDQAKLAEAFASPHTLHENRFAQGAWRTQGLGGPTLDGAVAHFDFKVAATFDYGSHTIVIGDALDAISLDARPLIYAERGFHRLPRV
jgi:flavin reductase (DIM6/NTAB) family NADH-FMN oxidoreductase RutF